VAKMAVKTVVVQSSLIKAQKQKLKQKKHGAGLTNLRTTVF